MAWHKRNTEARKYCAALSPANAFAMRVLAFLESGGKTIKEIQVEFREPEGPKISHDQVHDAFGRIRSYLEQNESASLVRDAGERPAVYKITESVEEVMLQATSMMARALGCLESGLRKTDMAFTERRAEMSGELRALAAEQGMAGHVAAGHIRGSLRGARVYHAQLVENAEAAARKPSARQLKLLSDGEEETWQERQKRLAAEAARKYAK